MTIATVRVVNNQFGEVVLGNCEVRFGAHCSGTSEMWTQWPHKTMAFRISRAQARAEFYYYVTTTALGGGSQGKVS
jgi:hypothetical protein